MAAYRVVNKRKVRRLVLTGRVEWALQQLLQSGAKGCTPLSRPALRWAGYIHVLRTLGVIIETIREKHEGAFPGWHARYVLRSIVTPEVGHAS
jgi:hypothetical protein